MKNDNYGLNMIQLLVQLTWWFIVTYNDSEIVMK
jgi:hypothetical protein